MKQISKFPVPLSRAKRGCTVVSLLMLSAKIKKLI
uniref:Uncharacterized protein n=1 Tax=Myoviridae sp. ct9Ns12 TaxID=2826626 RepID=A0A8S5MHK2_9CAUD|nr:MAG TPA: hypothetical protein [Myoviridae sp. ct9Ns12]DAI63979.1 MAG TPA: hypothetical protein [Caudoviricetes sp.]